MALVKYNNNSISAITAVAGLANGAMTLIKEQTASSSSTISFVDGTSDVDLDATYPIYLFKFINIHPATDAQQFKFNGSSDTGSNYNVTKTTTYFVSRHTEADATELTYETGNDLAQSTSFQPLVRQTGNDNDQSCSGELWLYSPSSTTFVKHFISRFNEYEHNDQTSDNYTAGYFNTTSVIDAVQFKFASGNIDSGTIKLYGIKDS